MTSTGVQDDAMPRRPPAAAERGEAQDVFGGLAPGYVRSAAADRLRALGHHDRLRIVEALAAGPKNVSEIAATVRMPAGTVSRHLRVLHDAQVVECSRRGNFALYVLADRDVARLAAIAYRGAGTQARRLLAAAPPR